MTAKATPSSSVRVEALFGGVMQFGIDRERGLAALADYSDCKTAFIAED